MEQYSPKIFLTFILLHFGMLFAQDSIPEVVLESNKIYRDLLHDDSEFIDVLFYKHHNNVLLNNLGTYGSPYYFPTVSLTDNQRYSFFKQAKKDLILSLDKVRPYTNLTWINAGRREQVFSFNHIQRFGDKASLDFIFQKISSPGVYINQEANRTDFSGSFNYNSLNKLYALEIFYDYKSSEQQTNGGLFNLNHFEKDTFERREVYEVNLTNSYFKNKNKNYGFSQRINFINEIRDSNNYFQAFIGHENSFKTRTTEFYDYKVDHGFYDSVYFDGTATFWVDSTFLRQYRNRFFVGFENEGVKLQGWFEYNQFRYNQYFGIDSSYRSNYTGISGTLRKKSMQTSLEAKYGISGFNKEDLELKFRALNNINENLNLTLNASYTKIAPTLYQQNFSSNHFQWNNDSLNKEENTSLSLIVNLNKWRLKLFGNARLVNQLIYYDTAALLTQHDASENAYSLGIEKNYSWKNIHGRTAIIYQSSSNELLLPMPELIGRQIVYYENKIFKKALKARIGANVSYTTEYFGYEFMPGVNNFHVQNNTKIGNYPFVDLFISLHIKRAQIFFKWEHLNSRMSGLEYFNTPSTPVLDRSFKFGVSWNMFD